MTSIFSAGPARMASSPAVLWIGCPLSLLLLLSVGCLAEKTTSEPGQQTNCQNETGRLVDCTEKTGRWCFAQVSFSVNGSKVDGNHFVIRKMGCSPQKYQESFVPPENATLRCFKLNIHKGDAHYDCFCNSGTKGCNDERRGFKNVTFFEEARRQYLAAFPSTNTATMGEFDKFTQKLRYECYCNYYSGTCNTYGEENNITQEAIRQYRADVDQTTTTTLPTTDETDSTPKTLTSTTIIIIGAIVVLVIGAVALSVIGCCLWKREQGRYASKTYGGFGLMQIVAKTVLEAWVKYDLKIEGEFGLSPEANAANLIKGEQLDKTFYFKPSQHKAMAPEKKVEVKVVEQKMVHANYVDDNIICTFEPDSSTIGVWIKMAVGVMPALIVTIDNQLELADILTCGLLGDNPAAPKQNAVPIKKKNKNGFQNKSDLISCRQIRLTDEEKSHECEHLMYGGWPEGDIPTMNNDISHLAAYVYENYVSQNKLIIITSNRGCGRAGTFAFTQVLLKAASTSNCSNDDVIEMAKKIRHSRFAAIGGPMQFGFGIALALSIHGTRLINEDLRKKSRFLERNFDTEIKNLHKLMSKAENCEKQNVPENPAGTGKKAESTGRSGRSEANQKPGSPVKEDPSMSKVAPEDTVYDFKSIR